MTILNPVRLTTATIIPIACACVSFSAEGVYGSTEQAGWEIVLEWGGHGNGPGQFSIPTDLAIDSSGEVYVADQGNNRVQVFDGNGTYLREWSTSDPQGIALEEEEVLPVPGLIDVTVYVLPFDFEQCIVQYYSSDGQYQGSWGSCSGAGSLQGAREIRISGGLAFIRGNALQEYTPSGEFVRTLVLGAIAGGIAVAPDGTVWVLCTNCGQPASNVVQQYATDGMKLREWSLDPSGGPHQFEGIAVGEGGSVYVTETTSASAAALHEFTLDGVLKSTTAFDLRGLGRLTAVGTDTLWVVSTGPPGVLKMARRQIVPVEPTTWGQIKAKYARESSNDE